MKKFFSNLFRKKDPLIKSGRDLSDSPTSPALPTVQKTDVGTIAVSTSIELPQLLVGCGQSIGKIRDHNEDTIFTISSLTVDEEGLILVGLFIVADGMGGHQLGEVASNLAVRTIASKVNKKILLPMFESGSNIKTGVEEILSESVLEAHKLISKKAPGSGSTVTTLLIIGEEMSIAHVGDSRAYSISLEGKVEALTRDHSLVQRMIELGRLTVDEASVHPQRNVLYRALGQGDPLSPDVLSMHVPNSGYLLLCSDGLWGVVAEDKIVEIILTSNSPDEACQMLIDAANHAGGPDNISAILVRLPIKMV